jgi:predicted lipoprotein
MAASEGPAPASGRLGNVPGRRWQTGLVAGGVAAVFCFVFPPFRIVSLKPAPAGRGGAPSPATTAPAAAFDPAAAAAKFWEHELPAAHARAVDLAQLAPAVRAGAEAAKTRFAQAAGLGTAYYFVRGSGKVVARERNTLRLSITGAETESVTIRLGPVFGNTVRDGTGLLDVNAFPGLQEFNALAAALNALVEQRVLPALKEKAQVGAVVSFVGCAEAPESAADPGEPLFTVVPFQAEVR